MSDQAEAVAPSIDDRIGAAMGLLEKEPEEAPQEQAQETPQETETEQAEEPASEPAQEDSPQPWADVSGVKVRVPLKNGDQETEETVSLDELRLGYMRTADYTRKTKEAAEIKRAAQEEAKQAVVAYQQQVANELKQMDAFITSVAMPEMQGVDWNKLAADDPAEFVRLSHRRNQLLTLKQQVSQKLQQAEQQRISEEEASRAQAIQQAQEQLSSEIPNWNAELQQALVKSGREYGYSDDELAKVYDPRLVKLLHAAHQWGQLQKQAPIVEKKVVNVPKILKSGASPLKADAARGKYEELRTRIKKSGGKDHAAVEDLIKSRLGV